jgi:PAS domain S-box-containing protein
MSARALRINREIVILSITRDITERKRTEEELRESEKRYRTLFEKTNDAIFVVDKRTGRILDANDSAGQLTGRALPDLCQLMTRDISPEEAEARLAAVALNNKPMDFGRVTYVRPDDTQRIALLNTVPLDDEKVFSIARDITNEVKLEEHFRQAQKMEAIGRLAGGIAHDFNNLLVPIVGYAELGMVNLSPSDKLYANLQRIHEAGKRAADLTQQILAFGRKQVLEMKALDLNEIVANFEKMMRRLIREDIILITILTPSRLPVRADPAQIEQILMNLVVNARDAMPQGGNLTVETGNIFLDEQYAQKHIEVQPGPYVLLAVSDTGIGMDAEIRERIFEPFFTTKTQGQGTGLGLATVFGIVKQHGGNIWVYSEPGQGTTFKIYLPQAENITETHVSATTQPVSIYGTETVLVVEDESTVRQLVCETLAAHGYRVLEAKSPAEGIELAAGYKDTLHLVLTDVVMPQMNGRQLYEEVAAIHPEIRVLYMSGYADNVIVHHGILEENVKLLQKPFTVHGLTQKVRAALS